MRHGSVRISRRNHDSRGGSQLRLDANWVDYLLIAHLLRVRAGDRRSSPSARCRAASTSSCPGGRCPPGSPGWRSSPRTSVPSRSSACRPTAPHFGIPTVHYFWIGAVPGDAVPRRRDDAVLLRLEGPLGPRVHEPAVRRRPPTWSTRSASRVAQLLIAGINLYLLAKHRQGPAGLAAVGLAARRRRDRAHLHRARRAVGRDLQRGAAVLRDRRGPAAADARRPAQGRRLQRPQGPDQPAARRRRRG